MAKQLINEHKRMAMGGNARGYAMGGTVLPAQAAPAAGAALARSMPAQARPMPAQAMRPGMKSGGSLKTGTPMNPIVKAKMGNSIPGMKKGGKC